ncbi:MAG: membrane dipeptidase [Candidatus Tectomicrobia bacterium]|uniref:Membrane dipeptidase n=1 Tax=Tectimicrobiota bacterium TaxID=2528274 RepID=A0A932MNT2_UNCTE|nr:membrane dipeptidase [Candidatus Tectomicrobia bacterium]
MPIAFGDIWDFHTDLRYMVNLPPDKAYLSEQIDLPAARRLGGVFSATGRKAGAPQAEQLKVLEEDVRLIRQIPGLTLVLRAADLEGTGRQVLHAEGIYFIEREADFKFLDWMWDEGFRGLGPLYNEDSALGGGAKGDPARGLTPLGRDFALRAWEKGFLVDCSHANHRTKDDLIDLALVTGNPLHYSHGHLDEAAVPAFGERGLPRTAARRLLETGGLIGLAPHPGFYAAFGRYMEEIDFLAEVAPAQVCLGTDFAGTHTPGPAGNRTFGELKGVWGVPAFAGRLARAHGEDFARSFCGSTLKECLRRSLP